MIMSALLSRTRCLNITLSHGTNGWRLEILELGDLTMSSTLLGLSSCPAYGVNNEHNYDDFNHFQEGS